MKSTHVLDKRNFLSSSERFRTRRYHLNGYCQVNRKSIFMFLYYQTWYETTCHLINDAVMNQHPSVSPKRTNDKRLGDWKEEEPGIEVHCHKIFLDVFGWKPSNLCSLPSLLLSSPRCPLSMPHLPSFGVPDQQYAICSRFLQCFWLDDLLRKPQQLLLLSNLYI